MASVSQSVGTMNGRLQPDDQAIRVFILGECSITRSGLAALLGPVLDIVVVGSSAELEDIHRPQKLDPDVLLLDVTSGRQTPPAWLGAAAHARRLVVLSRSVGFDGVLPAGAHECLTERSSVEDLLRSLRAVLGPPDRQSPSTTAQARPAPPRLLSQREMRVLTLLALGHTVKQIAAEFGVSARTVETYRARAVRKLQLDNRRDIVRHAMRQGWLTRSTS